MDPTLGKLIRYSQQLYIYIYIYIKQQKHIKVNEGSILYNGAVLRKPSSVPGGLVQTD